MIKPLLLLVSASLITACLATPLVFSLLKYLVQDFPYPFSRVFNRVAMVSALVWVIILRNRFNLKFAREMLWNKGDNPKRAILSVLLGLSIALLSSITAVFFLLNSQTLIWDYDQSSFFYRLLKALGAGVLVSLIEEVFFRALLLKQALSSKVNIPERAKPVLAYLSITSLYVFVHFIEPNKAFSYEHFDILGGFFYLMSIFSRILLPGTIEVAFSLFLVGSILWFSAIKTNRIWLGFGLHMGWILAVKLTQALCDLNPSYLILEGAGRKYALLLMPETWLSLFVAGILVYLLSASYLARESQIASEPRKEPS